jgi:hypothetical protein
MQGTSPCTGATALAPLPPRLVPILTVAAIVFILKAYDKVLYLIRKPQNKVHDVNKDFGIIITFWSKRFVLTYSIIDNKNYRNSQVVALGLLNMVEHQLHGLLPVKVIDG